MRAARPRRAFAAVIPVRVVPESKLQWDSQPDGEIAVKRSSPIGRLGRFQAGPPRFRQGPFGAHLGGRVGNRDG